MSYGENKKVYLLWVDDEVKEVISDWVVAGLRKRYYEEDVYYWNIPPKPRIRLQAVPMVGCVY